MYEKLTQWLKQIGKLKIIVKNPNAQKSLKLTFKYFWAIARLIIIILSPKTYRKESWRSEGLMATEVFGTRSRKFLVILITFESIW